MEDARPSRRPLAALHFGVIFLVLSACFPRVGPPPGSLTQAQLERAKQQWPDAEAEALEHGRQTFLDHCDDCHGYPDLTYKTAEQWPKTARRMAVKGDIDPKEVDMLVRFILAARP